MTYRRLSTALCILFMLCALCLCTRTQKAETIKIILGGEIFSVEVARTQEQRQKGFMFRSSLGSREGMLFIFESDQRLSFWMKNTSIPLSIAFISSKGEILEIADMKPISLKSVISSRSARYALEVPLGTFKSLGVEVGARITFPENF